MALDAAIGVFREHGFEGTSTEMLVKAMGIGRQSLYDTFGDKWQLYQSALQRYSAAEVIMHSEALRQGSSAIHGIQAMLDRVVVEAKKACLGVSATCEFGRSKPELAKIQDVSSRVLRTRIAEAILQARTQGDIPNEVDPDEAADYLIASIAGIRIAARGGLGKSRLNSLTSQVMRGLR